MIDRISHFYAHENSNIHRAPHELAARATDAYEDARERVRKFIHAPDVNEVIFVHGTTEAINLVAKNWGGSMWARATRSSSAISNTTPTSCRGSNWRRPRARSCA